MKVKRSASLGMGRARGARRGGISRTTSMQSAILHILIQWDEPRSTRDITPASAPYDMCVCARSVRSDSSLRVVLINALGSAMNRSRGSSSQMLSWLRVRRLVRVCGHFISRTAPSDQHVAAEASRVRVRA